MKRLLSASLLALLACSNIAQAETDSAQNPPCAVGGPPCPMQVSGNGPRDLQIHGLWQTERTYTCRFTVTGGGRESPKAIKIEGHANTPYPELVGKRFRLNAPLVVDKLPPGPMIAIFKFRNTVAKSESLDTSTFFTVHCTSP